MPTKVINLQDNFLNQLRKDGAIVTIHLVNGFQIKGNIKAFDNFVLLLSVDAQGKQQMVYKHAISTITPLEAVKVTLNSEKTAQ